MTMKNWGSSGGERNGRTDRRDKTKARGGQYHSHLNGEGAETRSNGATSHYSQELQRSWDGNAHRRR